MLFNLILKLQQKPLPERRRIAVWLAFALTLLIAGIWLLTALLTSSSVSSNVQKTPKAPSPLETFWGGLKDSFSGVQKYLPTE